MREQIALKLLSHYSRQTKPVKSGYIRVQKGEIYPYFLQKFLGKSKVILFS